MMASKPTDLNDARKLKRAGSPSNLALTHRTFSQDYSEHWFRLMATYNKFMVAVHGYSDGPRAGAVGQWKVVKRRFNSLSEAMQGCDAFIGKLRGNATPPVFKSEQDGHECNLLSYFLVDRAMPFAEFWQGAIDAVDTGTPLKIMPGDAPKWFDGE
jgi:hypothetical protein